MMKKRLYVDMDGTLAEFKPVNKLETLYEKNYFSSLKPNMSVVDAITSIIENDSDIEVFILSAYLTDSKYALSEKNKWLNEYLPSIDYQHRIFVPCGQSKLKCLEEIDIDVGREDYLLDDYTLNLNEWDPPGIGIKLLNGINGTRGTWVDDQVSMFRSAEELADKLRRIIKDGEPCRDVNPNQKAQIGKER